MAEIKDYSVTADDNNATSPAGMPENMAPSGVNNSWRESFARVKRWYEDINGTKSTTGSSNAYVLAAARTVTAYAQGDAYLFRANFTNTAAVTLNVDSVGAVAIVNNTQSALAAGQIQSGGMYLVAYDASNSNFQLVGASATSASGDNIFIFNASPSATLENSTAEDTAGGRESTIQWKGLQSGSEESTLVKIIGSHDGTADDQKGKLQIYTNDGADGDSPTLQLTIDSAGLCALVGAATIGGSLTVTGVTTHGGNVVSDTDSTDDLGTTSVRWANLFVDGITATDQITATGFTGTLDGILGSGAAAAATVTTLDTSGVVNLNLTTDSSSSTSGALIIDGGVGIAKKLFVGTDADIPAITGLTSINSGQIGGSRNKIINGAMVIDQRNAGASVTPTNGLYTLDRWQGLLAQASKYTVIQSATAPTGFIESLKVTSSSAYSLADGDYFDITQYVEGQNMADLAWGTASAATVTLSFYVRSSLTGTFGGSLQNNGQARSYPFSYAISSADTWEKKSITIAGDTSGTWLTTNGRGIQLNFSLGTGATFSGSAGSWAGANYLGTTSTVSVVSTNAATWYVTGVQLEKGSTDTEFEHRGIGEELALCQRYLYKSIGTHAYTPHGLGSTFAANQVDFVTSYPVKMRTNPTASYDGTVSAAKGTTASNFSSVGDAGGSTFNSFLRCTLAASSFTIGDCLTINNNNDATGYIQFDAEL